MCSCKLLLSPTDVKLSVKFKRNPKSNLVNLVNIMILKIQKYFFFNEFAPVVDGEDVIEKEIQMMMRLRHEICFWENKALMPQTLCLEN